MEKRYLDKPLDKYPAAWKNTPADDKLGKAYDAAMNERSKPPEELSKRYGSLYGAILHAVKYRGDVAAVMSRLGSCLSICTEELYECLLRVLVYLVHTKNIGPTYSLHAHDAMKLKAYADSDWSVSRSTTGFVIMLAGASISHVSRRQHCVTMSSTEAELVALADCAIELLYVMRVLEFIGYEIEGPIEVYTDNKGAHDLCHHYSAAQHSRHIDRKLFKMRELRGAEIVDVRHVAGTENPADVFTKVLSPQVFHKHRKTVMNLHGNEQRDDVSMKDGRLTADVNHEEKP